MHLHEAISLIQHAVPKYATAWADLGCGDGLFTNALSYLLPGGSLIYAVDKNKSALNNVIVRQGILLEKLALDFVHDDLLFKDLSGILMANAFHFVKDKHAFAGKILNCLATNGYLLIVEYDTDIANNWVPYPVSFINIKKIFEAYDCTTEKSGVMPSRYQGSMYAAIIRTRI